MKDRFDIVMVCGGTGGHVFPALAVAEEMRRSHPQVKILFILKKGGFEEKVIGEAGFAFRSVRMEGFNRSHLLRNLRLLWIFPMGFFASLAALSASGARVVFNTGGYIGVPVLWSAILLRKRIALLALDVYPGVTVRFFARFADVLFLAFQEAANYLPKGKRMVEAGNPLRLSTGKRELDLRKEYGIASQDKILFIFGGSQGARGINRVIAEYAKQLVNENKVTVFWQTGKPDFEEIKKRVAGLEKVRILPFIENIYDFYRCADLAVCRAGAMTVSELALFGLPAVFVPLPTAAEDHQTVNARMVESRGAGLCVAQAEAAVKLYGVITALLNDGARLTKLREKMKSLHRENAAREIAAQLTREIQS